MEEFLTAIENHVTTAIVLGFFIWACVSDFNKKK